MVKEIPAAKPSKGAPERRLRVPFWIYEDPARNLALIRGNPATVREALEYAGMSDAAKYSVTGKGWVISLECLPNLAAMSDYAGIPYRIKMVGE